MTAQQNRNTLLKLMGVIALMGVLVIVSVPLYDWFCRVTGFGGTPLQSDINREEILTQTINVRFDASLERNMPWEFKAAENLVTVNLGESKTIYYIAHNPTDNPITGSATFNVFPFTGGEYFVKLQCFCFIEQELAPGESKEMPVVFYVDPEILNDPETKNLESITLSYTFHKVEDKTST